MDMPGLMVLFAKVVENGSFSETARKVGQTPSAISKQVAQLEQRCRLRLLHRTKTGVTMTGEGRAFYAQCREVAQRVDEAEEMMSAIGAIPSGRLRVNSTVAFGKACLMPVLPEFMERHPEIALSLELSDRPIDLEKENIDAAIRFTEQMDAPDVIQARLMTSQRVLVATQSYLDRAGTPVSAADLAGHNCLQLSTFATRNDWAGIPGVTSNFEGNSADVVLHGVRAGLGIGRLPEYLVAADLESGALQRVLPQETPPQTRLAVIYADKRNLAPKIRVFVDFLTERFRGH